MVEYDAMSDTQKTYEISFLLTPKLSDKEAERLVKEIADITAETGFDVEETHQPQPIELAYSLEVEEPEGKSIYEQALFGWLVAGAQTADITEVDRYLAQENQVLRHLILSEDKDDLLGRELLIGADEEDIEDEEPDQESTSKEDSEDEKSKKEQIDEKIDEIVAE